jgi:hypothetical protein
MELDELKDIWRKTDSGFQPKAEAELASMLKGNSKSIVNKLKRSVWFELIFALVAGIALLIYALTMESNSLKWTYVSILVLFVGYSFYYIKKLTLLNQFNPAEDNLKGNLEKLIGSLTSYLKFYKRSYTTLYPVYFCLGLLFAGVERGLSEFLHVVTTPRTLAFLLLPAAIFFLVSNWLVNWFLKKLYGNHLDKLRRLLSDLNSFVKLE